MTEKDFLGQVWRMHDRITTTESVPGKVLGVNFTTKSVRAFISGAPEWVHCDLIETHTTGNGKDGDEVALTEQLQTRLDFANQRIEVLKDEIEKLQERLTKNYSGELMKNVNIILNVVREKKTRVEKMEECMELILQTIGKINTETDE